MVASVVKKSRDAGTKSVNVVHVVDRAYAVWPRELKKAFAEQGAGGAFIFQAATMHALDVRVFVLLPRSAFGFLPNHGWNYSLCVSAFIIHIAPTYTHLHMEQCSLVPSSCTPDYS
jgi:hypothetical protein